MTLLIGKSDVGASAGGNDDMSVFSRFQCAASGTVDTLYFRIGESGGTFLRLALFSDNAGVVNDVLAQGAVTTRTANSWVSVTGLSVEVTKDTYYWLAARLDGYFLYDAGRRAYVPYTGDNAFTNDPGSLSYDDNVSMSIYADGLAPTNIEITAVTITATAAAQVPAVVGGTDATTTAALATGSAVAVAPTITAEIFCTVAGAAAAAGAAFASPTIYTWAEAEVGPCWADGLFPPPTITGSASVAAPCATAAGAAPAPAVTIIYSVTAPTATATALLTPPGFYTRWHVILTAKYSAEAPDTNRFYVAGSTPAGLTVSGEAVDLATGGERLAVHHDAAIGSTAFAEVVADAMLVKARLESMSATITIPPHCGLELWDILTLVDTVANQDTNYRVSGYIFDYDTRQGIYQQTIELCAP